MGIIGSSFSPRSHERLTRERLFHPLAGDTDAFSSATDGGSQAAVDISAAAAGDAVERSALGKKSLATARVPSITTVDDSGTDLSVTVKLVGRRFGARVEQSITATGAGGGETVSGTKAIDELTSATITAIANEAASDTLAIGFDGKRIALQKPIKSVKSVKRLEKIAWDDTNDVSLRSVTGANTIATATLQSSTYIRVADSTIDVYTLYSNTAISANDVYEIEYIADGPDEFDERGRFA